MAISVPQESKTYTTVYESFKGVDFTNDASNVYKRRSPGAVNMIPDLDGRPYKRHGWRIENPASDFLSAAGSQASTYIADRIHHFSIAGQDYMVFFNSLGVFYKSEESYKEPGNVNGIVKIQLASGDIENPTLSSFPPPIGENNLNIDADSGRAFFFEGKGTAGFYCFVSTKLFRFDGKYFWEVEPYIPTLLVACDKYGAGTMLESVNLLTRKRIVQYLCDGENTEFYVPAGVWGNDYKVELKAEDGSWEETHAYTLSEGVITFNTAPPVVVEGEDNMRITYTPGGAYITAVPESHEEEVMEVQDVTEEEQKTAQSTYRTCVKYVRDVDLEFNVSGNTVSVSTSYGAWTQVGNYYPPRSLETYNEPVHAAFVFTNQVSLDDITFTPSGGTPQATAYRNCVNYTPPKSAWNSVPETVTAEEIDDHLTLDGKAVKKADLVEENQKYYNKNKKLKWKRKSCKKYKIVYAEKVINVTADYNRYYTYSASTGRTETVITEKIQHVEGTGEYMTHDASAFNACERSFVYGSGLYNQVFFSASSFAGYNSRVWYSMASDPTYVPDTNYIEAGGDDTHIVGMMKVSGYVGIIKQGSAMDASVYLAYPTSFEEDTTFAVTQSINGVGALANGAFNILNAEPLYLSKDGVMGIEVSEEEVDRKVRSRSYFINKKLTLEPDLANAVSFVHKGMYYLAINDHVYVLDGSQKNSWANEKTNFQYECYYLENLPVQCFSAMDGELYFTDHKGNLCKLKEDTDEHPYRDEYSLGEPTWTMASAPTNMTYQTSDFDGDVSINDTVLHGTAWYTVTDIEDDTVTVDNGVPVYARWDTIADDDGAVHFFKNLQKKGCVISLLPASDSGVTVYLKADEKDAKYVGSTDREGQFLPSEFYPKKKMKKYKRLQIICENNGLDESFGIDQIIKTYTLGNYSKNRG